VDWFAEDELAGQGPRPPALAPPPIAAGPMLTPDELAALEDQDAPLEPERVAELAGPPAADTVAASDEGHAEAVDGAPDLAADHALPPGADAGVVARPDDAVEPVEPATATPDTPHVVAALEAPPPVERAGESLSVDVERAFDQVNFVEPPAYDW